jgi:D-glycero-alpha-D-manno-heptose-7-phosphate kinase
VTREIIGRAPTRIDLGGGWTDVPPYCDREGGFVCNMAITRYAIARVCNSRVTSAAVRMSSEGDTTTALVRAALKRTGFRDSDVQVTIANDFPVASGLGGSSAASAALLGALAEWRGKRWARADLAEEGRRIEVEELGIAGGRQDHYAATHGGALALTFTKIVGVRRIPLSATTRAEFAARSVLIYTGQSRISGDTISAVLGAYEARDPRVLASLRRMRELAQEMATSLERGDVDDVGELLREHWVHQRALHPSIPTPRIDEIIARARKAGALGAKAMGASGGGCVLIMARAPDVDRVRESVAALGDFVDFAIDTEGLTVSQGAV